MGIRRVCRWRAFAVGVAVLGLSGGVVVLSPAGAAGQGAAPVATGGVPDVELTVAGAARSVAVGEYFSGAVSSYGAASSSVGVAAVSVSASVVTLTPRGAGSAIVTVTATNAAGSASQALAVKVLPAGCVVALGALSAGSIVTQAGSWDSDDGCRSTNAAGGSGDRYARYVSFTVGEAIEARFDLVSPHAGRLYLLEGAGTGGRVVASAGTTRVTWAASFRHALEAGDYTLETAAYHTEQEATFSVSIDSMPLNPPEACVASLGALTSGAALAHSGTWDRDDACRSKNATAYQTTRYYAAYVSFTISEPVEATLGLSSTVGTRLYLLEGAGPDGRVVASATSRSGRAASSLRHALQAGAYTLEAAAYSTEREAAFTLNASAAPAPPTKRATLAAREIPASRDAARIDLAAAFAGTIDTYGATSSDTTVVTTSVNGSTLTLTGIAAGTATVTVTAANTAGRATQAMAVTVHAVTAPQAAGALAAQTLTAGGSVVVDVAAAFAGTIDTYGATSSDATVVTTSVNGSTLTLTGIAAGTATVTVTAANTAGRATQAMAVTVASAAPTAVGALAARTLTAGDSAEVDVAGAFAGTVDSYAVTTHNAGVVDVALAGSTVTLTGIAAGTATVTVTAANAAGRATQTMAVTVDLPPAPTLAGRLAAQALQVAETLAVDISAGFAGRVDTYTAVSGDAATLTATTDGPMVSLTGLSVGSARVTVTAVNAAGRAARTFNVTVNALTAPQAAGTPIARTIAVGEELPVHIADAFTGIIATYSATSSDTTTATASVDGSTVTLTGVAAGATTVSLQAANAAGTATQALPVTVEEPEELAVAVAAPSHCLGSEGTHAPGGGRRGVGSIDVTYHITGGAGPYTLTSPDAPHTTRTEPTGTITVPCAQRGIDLNTVTPEVNVVESGPRTITLTATDNTGATTTTNIGIEVAEDAYTTEYNGGLMHPGKTYVLGTREQWVLLTLPDTLTLRFAGLSEHNMAHFTEPATGAEIILDWTTGTEIRRTTPTTSDTD